MVINQTCKNNSEFISCRYKVDKNTLILDTPPVSGQILFQCCPGDVAGVIVGSILGFILLVVLIVLAVYFIRKFIKKSLLREKK